MAATKTSDLLDRMAALLREAAGYGGVISLPWWRRADLDAMLAEYDALHLFNEDS